MFYITNQLNMSTIAFRIEEDIKNQFSEITEKLGINSSTALRIFINKVIKTNFKIKEENLNGKIVNVEFRNENPISPLDILISPDSRKLGFLLLNFKLLN